MIRAELRAFAHFTEQVTSGAGLTPQQHQILLALRASDGGTLTIGELATTMLLKPHSISGMADRLAALGLVERVRAERDRRRVHLRLTKKADDVLASLGQAHKAELRRIRPLLSSLLSELD
ncbi:MAG TPA: helix-turn-helix domain-containing protein [Sphingomicrobium sp.]|nr:helix-turn-helix domain-containing protein [Sphingomicrobium sp.]